MDSLPYSITPITPASTDPVTLAEAKLQANIDANLGDDNTLIEGYIKAATLAAEKYTSKTFIDTIFELRIDKFPANDGKIFFPRFPVSEIIDNEFKYVDEDEVTQTWASNQFTLFSSQLRPYVKPAFLVTYPNTLDYPEVVRIQFKSGYGPDGVNVPITIRQAILIAVSHLYRYRDGTEVRGSLINTPLPDAFYLLLDSEKVEILV